MSLTLAGRHPKTGKPVILATHIPSDMKAEIEADYARQGYTDLTWGRVERKEEDDEADGPAAPTR
jgi:hypothetical protein